MVTKRVDLDQSDTHNLGWLLKQEALS